MHTLFSQRLATMIVLFLNAPGLAQELRIRVLSGRPDMVSGGDALVQISGIRPAAAGGVSVFAGTRDVTKVFREGLQPNTLLGRIEALPVGKTTLSVRTQRKTRATLELTNFPIIGPIFSGPHQQPFACQPESVNMGPPLDKDCSLPTKVTYFYYSSLPPTTQGPVTAPLPTTHFRTYDPAKPRPADMTQTTTTEGKTVDFIVRREVGTINRAIYSIAFLHEPGKPLPDPWTKTPGWNGRLVFTFQGGCEPGYRQGDAKPPLTERVLAQGYAEAGSTLNTFGNNANDVLSAETMMMIRERFIEEYGVPVHTLGNGGSGGSMAQYLIAQNYPGLLDGLFTDISFPDTFSVLPGVVDSALFERFFARRNQQWTEEQKTAVTGYSAPAVWLGWINAHYAPGWIDAKHCRSVPAGLIFDAARNPLGTRCDLYDNQFNIIGRDPKTGFALRFLDNVGVEYGLSALKAGTISVDQFLDLNESMGGFDNDGNMTDQRVHADREALRVAYQTGRINMGAGDLGVIPIIDSRGYRDRVGNFHDKVRTYEVQARLRVAHGHADNLVVLTQPPRDVYPLVLLDNWLDAIAKDSSSNSLASKVVRDRPSDVTDACWGPDGKKITETATYSGPGRCNELYPAHAEPRMAAGAPLRGTVLKCALKPVDAVDYPVLFSPEQIRRLNQIFPQGVCDYLLPGIGEQQPKQTWLSY